MRASSMLDHLTKNTRNYERVLKSAERELSDAHASGLRLENAVLMNVRKIANVQLDHGRPEEADVCAQLDLRQKEETGLRSDLGKIEATIEQGLLEISRLDQEVSATEAKADAALRNNPEYTRLGAEYSAVALSATAAKEMFEEIEAECGTKLAAFEQPLYRYLQGAAYGTNDYAGGRLVRYLDGLIAGLCRYQENRDSEMMLLAMRKENAIAFSARSTQAKSIQALMDRVRKAAPETTSLDQVVSRRDKVAVSVALAKKQANTIHKELSLYASNEDALYIKARDLLAAAIGEEQPADVLSRVQKTGDQSDDEALQNIYALRLQINENQSAVKALNVDLKLADANYLRAKSIERALRGSNYTNDRYEYKESLDLDALLVGYMAGSVSHESAINQVTSSRDVVEAEPEPYSSSPSRNSDSAYESSSSIASSPFETTDSF